MADYRSPLADSASLTPSTRIFVGAPSDSGANADTVRSVLSRFGLMYVALACRLSYLN